MIKSKEIYLDYASATPIEREVIEVIHKSLKEDFANPSAIHKNGVQVKNKLEKAREEIAEILGVHMDEIVFTSSATESNNLAILGIVKKFTELFLEMHTYSPAGELLCSARQPAQGISKNTRRTFLLPHIVTTNIEHPAVLEVCKYLEETKLAEVTYVAVEKNGIVDPKKIKNALKENTILVSVMYANNEIGTIQPIMEIAKEIRHYRKAKTESFSNGLAESAKQTKEDRGPEKNLLTLRSLPFFHTDATQAINYLPIKVEKLGVDLMSFNGSKIYGPKGTGVLFIKRNILINSISFGGEQELGLRPGTENVANILGLAEALKITEKVKEKETARLIKLRDYFIKELFNLQNQNKKFSRVLGLGPDQLENLYFDFVINGDSKNRLPNNVNITIPQIPSDLLLLELSARGIYVSEKSACKSGDKASSYVINALNGNKIKAKKICTKKDMENNSLRFSLGRGTTKADIDYTLKALSEILTKLKKWYN